MKIQEAIEILKHEHDYAQLLSYVNEALKMAISALEKQIPKKPYKVKEHKQNEYYCIVCNRYLGDEMELKYACLQPEYCQHCGQALDWRDHPTEKGGEG